MGRGGKAVLGGPITGRSCERVCWWFSRLGRGGCCWTLEELFVLSLRWFCREDERELNSRPVESLSEAVEWLLLDLRE